MKLGTKNLKALENIIAKHKNTEKIAPHKYRLEADGWVLVFGIDSDMLTISYWDRLGTYNNGTYCTTSEQVNQEIESLIIFFEIEGREE